MKTCRFKARKCKNKPTKQRFLSQTHQNKLQNEGYHNLLHGLVEYSILIGQFRTRLTLLIQNRQTAVKDLLTVVKDAHICTKKSGRFICIQFGWKANCIFKLTRQDRQENSGEVPGKNPPFYAASRHRHQTATHIQLPVTLALGQGYLDTFQGLT